VRGLGNDGDGWVGEEGGGNLVSAGEGRRCEGRKGGRKKGSEAKMVGLPAAAAEGREGPDTVGWQRAGKGHVKSDAEARTGSKLAGAGR
jgi:hypothetical protein